QRGKRRSTIHRQRTAKRPAVAFRSRERTAFTAQPVTSLWQETWLRPAISPRRSREGRSRSDPAKRNRQANTDNPRNSQPPPIDLRAFAPPQARLPQADKLFLEFRDFVQNTCQPRFPRGVLRSKTGALESSRGVPAKSASAPAKSGCAPAKSP